MNRVWNLWWAIRDAADRRRAARLRRLERWLLKVARNANRLADAYDPEERADD